LPEDDDEDEDDEDDKLSAMNADNKRLLTVPDGAVGLFVNACVVVACNVNSNVAAFMMEASEEHEDLSALDSIFRERRLPCRTFGSCDSLVDFIVYIYMPQPGCCFKL
jgi:hypothetical protein